MHYSGPLPSCRACRPLPRAGNPKQNKTCGLLKSKEIIPSGRKRIFRFHPRGIRPQPVYPERKPNFPKPVSRQIIFCLHAFHLHNNTFSKTKQQIFHSNQGKKYIYTAHFLHGFVSVQSIGVQKHFESVRKETKIGRK